MQPEGQPEIPPALEVARRLKGDIPCVTCGYNLRKLSVLEVCPECGTPVRATVLAVVDPYASVLQPVRWKSVVATGVILWAAAGFGAALISWLLRAVDMYAVLTGAEIHFPTLAKSGAFLVVLSCIGALVLIRPHAQVPVRQSVLAAMGVLTGLGAAWMYWRTHVAWDPYHLRPFVESVVPQPERAWLRLQAGGLLAATVLLLRPSARMLAARSLVLRMGRVDRQTMLAMAAALGVAAVGDLARLGSHYSGEPLNTVLNTMGIVLIAVGSMLFTLGLGGMVVDCVRIAKVIMKPAAAMADVVEDGA